MVEAWIYSQLVKARQYRPEFVDGILEELLARQNELRWLLVVGAYMDEEINLGKAAELLGMHRLELQEQFIRQGSLSAIEQIIRPWRGFVSCCGSGKWPPMTKMRGTGLRSLHRNAWHSDHAGEARVHQAAGRK